MYRVKRLRSFRYKEGSEDYISKEIIERLINTVSDAPQDTDNIYLQSFEDGYTKALEKVAKIIEAGGAGEYKKQQ